MASTATLAQMPGFFTVTATAQETLGRKRSLQAERRRSELWTDQHGREWSAEMDLKTGHPCTPLTPNGWAAPILPPSAFQRFGTGRGRPIMTIDYDGWREHQGALQAEYEGEVRRLAARMFPNSWAAEIQRGNPLILQEAGPPPYAVDFVDACAAGSRWVLGFSPEKPQWLTPELENTLPRRRGKLVAVSRVSRFDDAEAVVERLDGAARYEDLDDDYTPEPTPRRVRARKRPEPMGSEENAA